MVCLLVLLRRDCDINKLGYLLKESNKNFEDKFMLIF